MTHLVGIKRGHQIGHAVELVLQGTASGIQAGLDDLRIIAEEDRCEGDPAIDHGGGHSEMMPVQHE